MSETSAKPYRRGVGIMLLASDKRIFVGRRIDTPGAWQMPQGGIDKDETPRDAALRELHEEVGTHQAEILAETRDWLTYELPGDLHLQAWGGRYRGQQQKWFAFRFTGRDDDIDIARENPEFSAWQWAPFDSLPDLIVPFKRTLYRRLIEEFRPLVTTKET